MLNPFKNLFGKTQASVIGIDIGSSSIKIVQLSGRHGQPILETYGELALGPYSGLEIGRATSLPSEKVSQALLDLMKESKVTSYTGGLAIPFGSSLISNLEMPPVSEAQLAQMIPLEARKYIPVPIGEVSLDWWVVPKSNNKIQSPAHSEEKIDVLLVAIHNDILACYQAIVSQASLEASFFEIEIFSTMRSIVDEEVSNQMIIDMGAATTKIYIVEQGIIRISHIINRGAQDVNIGLSKAFGISFQDAEIVKRDITKLPADKQKDVTEVMKITTDYLLSEAKRVLGSYKKKHNKSISQIVMVGGGAQIKGILDSARTYFDTKVVLGNPFEKVIAPNFLQEILKNTGPEFAVAVGLALRKLQEAE